jgi:hypothetical protein
MIRSRKESKETKRVRSLQEISKKPCEEFKTVNSILLTKYCSHHTEISTKDIVAVVMAVPPMQSISGNGDGTHALYMVPLRYARFAMPMPIVFRGLGN